MSGLVTPAVAAVLVELGVDVLGQLLGLGTLARTGHAPAVGGDGVDGRVADEVGALGVTAASVVADGGWASSATIAGSIRSTA